MKKKKSYFILCPVLIFFWFFPLLYGGLSFDAEYVKALAAPLLYLIAAMLCRLLSNLHVAMISAMAVGVGLCVLNPWAGYDFLPVLLLCCWLRCYMEKEKGNDVRIYFELFTDLFYASLVFIVIRLIRNGYSFIKVEYADTQTVSEVCIMAVVFLFFFVLFFLVRKNNTHNTNRMKNKQKKAHGSEIEFTGLIPVRPSMRTFCGFCVLLLVACFLQYTNSKLIHENILFMRTGFRVLFFPWMVMLFMLSAYLFGQPGFSGRYLRR